MSRFYFTLINASGEETSVGKETSEAVRGEACVLFVWVFVCQTKGSL